MQIVLQSEVIQNNPEEVLALLDLPENLFDETQELKDYADEPQFGEEKNGVNGYKDKGTISSSRSLYDSKTRFSSGSFNSRFKGLGGLYSIEVYFFDNSSMELTITENHSAIDTIEIVSNQIELQTFMDFKFCLIDSTSNKIIRFIDDSEKIFKLYNCIQNTQENRESVQGVNPRLS